MIKIRKEKDETIVSLFQVKKLNTLFSGLVESQLAELVREDSNNIYFDLSGISFIDSSGFSTLLNITEMAKEYNKDFMLCNITDEVEELVSMLGIGNRFKIEHKELKSEPLMLEVE